MRVLTTVVLTCSCWVCFASLAGSAGAQGTESIGDQLLEDLTPGMFDAPANKRDSAGQNGASDERGPELHFRMPTRLDHWGEDLGATRDSSAIALHRAHDGMEQATSLLSKPETLDEAGAAQQQVIVQLDELIAALSKQCQGGECKPGDAPPKPSQRAEAKQAKSDSKTGRGNTAARDSTDALGNANPQAVEQGDIRDVVKELWGHLPERARDEMLQSFSGDFLPEYEREIEQYYRRLAEESADND